METIFHETQDGLLCAQHCLNSLLQGDYYSAVDLANIAHELDTLERNYMSEAGSSGLSNNESSNYDDTGYFSIQVLQTALKSWNLELIPFASSNELAKQARLHPTEQNAYICNFKQHWYTIRKIGPYWFNLNSVFKKPELISDTYLAILLKQLQTDGYSIFIVSGDLPRSQADLVLCETNLNVKEILNKQTKNKKSSKQIDNSGFDDDELKKAIQMSLAENEVELNQEQLYPSLAHTNSIDENEELKKAIELSLQANNPDEPTTSKNPETLDEVRKRRLEYLDKMSKNQQEKL